MKNSPIEILALGHDESSDEILFSLNVRAYDLKKWLAGQCSADTFTRFLHEELLTESMRLFDFGQDFADQDDLSDLEISIYDSTNTLVAMGNVDIVTPDAVTVEGQPYSLDDHSIRYADGSIRDKFEDLYSDFLIDLSC